jgi:DnaK suppressor protein
MATTNDASEVRRELDTERAGLQARLEELGQGGGRSAEGSLSFDDNFADSGQVAAEQGEVQAIAGQLRDQLREVERALAKLDDGSYGRCEVCNEPISEARLEAMPAANTCIRHA